MSQSGKRRVVVTGLGVVTPLGNTLEATWAGLMAGKSGAGPITRFDARDFSVRFACEVKGFEPLDHMDTAQALRTGPFTHYAIAASNEALTASGLKITQGNAERIGVFVSASIGDFHALERAREKFLKEGFESISPFLVESIHAHVASQEVAIRNRLKGPTLCTPTACAAGNHAIGNSFRMIERGDVDVMICGGAESPITPMIVGGFAAMRALSTRNDDPQRASRPFDRDRDGFVVGEGSGVLILEELEHARKRDANVYAEIVGYGATGDAQHITMPDETQSGVVRVMQLALAEGRVDRDRIGYINAHGTSTPLGDRSETFAVKKAFGTHAQKLAFSSTKSMTGHLLGAAGGIEAAFTVMSIRQQKVPPTINYTTPDPVCDLDYVPNQPRDVQIEFALTNGFGFGGTNTSLLFSRFDEFKS